MGVKIGEVRIEDIVIATNSGCKDFTNFPKYLEV